MFIHDLANKEFETKDDLVVDIANAIKEVDEQTQLLADTQEEVNKLNAEVNSLKAKNLELLAMIPAVVEETKKEPEEPEEISEEEIYW